MKYSSYRYVVAGAALWGTIGLFVDALAEAGFSVLQIVTLRVASAALMLTIFLVFKNPDLLKIRPKDTIHFIGTGLFSMVFFNWCYFEAIRTVSLSVAVILLYTGPAFVVILSRIVFGEPLSPRKSGALLATLLGCILVTKFIPPGDVHISWYGLLAGLGSGFGYALYSIFGKQALKRYDPLTVITYTFIVASVVMVPLTGMTFIAGRLSSQAVWMLITGLGLIPTALAYFLYTTGLKDIESGRASITATVEPVVATLIGVFLFQEQLSLLQIAGMLLILTAVILIQWKRRGKVIRSPDGL